MITLFATPKHFSGNINTIQLNALRSWRALSHEIQIIIFGDSDGSKEAAEEIRAEYIANVKCSPQGTPLLSDMFRQADIKAKFPILTFINADIILPKTFLSAVELSANLFNNFLMVGHRWDMDVEEFINFKTHSKQNIFWKKVANSSIKHSPSGIDYFVYRKDQWKNLPNFIIGRPGYDNWLIWRARRNLIPVIDVSDEVVAVHQNHNYNYRNDTKYNSKSEGFFNRSIIKNRTLNILDCTYKLYEGNIIRKDDKEFKIRNLYRLPRIFPELSILIKIYRRIYKYLNE